MMNKAKADYDSRQIRRMARQVEAFVDKVITLSELISTLDGLLSALEGVDVEWKREFQKQWGVLEDIYANAQDKSLPTIPQEHLALADKAIAAISRLIAQKL